ncbi:cyclic AMP-dependent transcription factor ATF-4 isoform X1 [Sander lucioperca]|uniref:cyclic AMP-dependent transcription factor ATF-4 isoform X1 n=1 Tax=Sander lucioperca TaxID=283035 RepID=UPI00125CFD9E|nr:cyclic AMP-dependent transcription factor ATF-4 isoform X1 [Sander lucioperca]
MTLELALEDVEALYLGPSFLMADPMGPLLDQDEEEALSPSTSLEGKAPASPPLSFSSPSPYQTLSSSPFSSASPPPSPPPPPPTQSSLFLGTKAGVDSLSLPWLGASDLLNTHVRADDGNADDAFAGMDWMSEKIDLSEFDLESLIGSCSSDESPTSPKDLLASLDSHMDLDLDSFGTSIHAQHESLELGLSLPSIPPLPLELSLPGAGEAKKTEVAPDQEFILKSEPPSPAPSPTYTLELGSEVDVLDAEKTATSLTATIIPDPNGSYHTTNPIVLSIPTSGHFVVVLTSKDEPSLVSLPDQSVKTSPPSSDCDSDSGIESVAGSPARLPCPPPAPSPAAGSSRTKPYSKPEPCDASSPSAKTSRVKSVSGAPKVEKKLKKMEQNKTAATRYRQKKRVEKDLLQVECDELEKRNHELAEKADSISREIQYLKDLMEEVRKRRVKTSSVAS